MRPRPASLLPPALLCVAALLGAPVTPATAGENPVRGKHVQVALVAEHEAVARGQVTTVGIQFQPDPHWHAYWRNPGDAGEAPQAIWTLPEGVTAGPIQWPTPIRRSEGPVITYGYEGAVLLPVDLHIPADFAATELRVVADVSWLVCHDECVPGKAQLELRLPVLAEADAVQTNARWGEAFAATRRLLPKRIDPEDVRASVRDGTLTLALAAGTTGVGPEATWEIFPYAWQVIAPDASTVAAWDGEAVLLTHPVAPKREDALASFEGVVVATADGERHAFAIEAPVEAPVEGAPVPMSTDESQGSWGRSALAVGLLGLFTGAMLGLFRRKRRPPQATPGNGD